MERAGHGVGTRRAGRPRWVPTDRVGDERSGTEEPDRGRPDEERPETRASHTPKAPQSNAEDEVQPASRREVGDLHPSVLAQRQRADRMPKRVAIGSCRALEEEHRHEQRTREHAAAQQQSEDAR